MVHVLTKSSFVLLLAGSVIAGLLAQQSRPTFEVASIKRNIRSPGYPVV